MLSPGEILVLGGVDYDAQPQVATAKAPYIASSPRRGAMRGDAAYAVLPGSGREATEIGVQFRNLFRRDVSLSLTGADATEAALRAAAPKHQYIHFATHGFFAAERYKSVLARSVTDDRFGEKTLTDQSISGYHPGLLSGLVLAGANKPDLEGDDGILTALEVEALDLRKADLVVLSACETGLGKAAGGEGLLGLQRSFQIAGAKTLVSSLWKVDDTATQVLMTEFYTNLWEKKLGKLESLRQAQLTMLKRYDPGTRTLRPRGAEMVDGGQPQSGNSPYYWAAFVLSGDWR